MNKNIKLYIISSIIGANLPIMIGIFCAMLIDFLLWQTNATSFMFCVWINAYTNFDAFRGIALSWIIFGNAIFIVLKEHFGD